MIQHIPASTAGMHRVECKAGKPKLISNILPASGYTVWCQQCRIVHLVSWDALPAAVLRGIAETISEILARGDAPISCDTPGTP